MPARIVGRYITSRFVASKIVVKDCKVAKVTITEVAVSVVARSSVGLVFRSVTRLHRRVQIGTIPNAIDCSYLNRLSSDPSRSDVAAYYLLRPNREII